MITRAIFQNHLEMTPSPSGKNQRFFSFAYFFLEKKIVRNFIQKVRLNKTIEIEKCTSYRKGEVPVVQT